MDVLTVPLLTVVALDLCKQKNCPTVTKHTRNVWKTDYIYSGLKKNFTKEIEQIFLYF